ncbi:hypothetical protein KAR29_04960 [Aminithiophilus ramosus]|uniref:Uncharacterized protein n=1 Tax=Aminithiophilus ramosus TaxID=3029084 RepID=A0A9Q7AKL0_9BACT|nr:hypothetical protein [Aminithiophilus ramosus]QTX33245.1 hypothetical protein KAR29_04960 [Aminithiophilus ramosus]
MAEERMASSISLASFFGDVLDADAAPGGEADILWIGHCQCLQESDKVPVGLGRALVDLASWDEVGKGDAQSGRNGDGGIKVSFSVPSPIGVKLVLGDSGSSGPTAR